MKKNIRKVFVVIAIAVLANLALVIRVCAEPFSCFIEEKKVVLESGETTFTFHRYHKWDIIKVNDVVISQYFRDDTTHCEPVISPEKRKAKIEYDGANKKVVTITSPLCDMTEEATPYPNYLMELTVEIRRGLPCAFVQHRIKNLEEGFKASLIPHVAVVKSGSYTLPDMEKRSFIGEDVYKLEKTVIGKYDWLFLWPSKAYPDSKKVRNGLGIITKARFSQTHHVHLAWSVKKFVEKGDCIEIEYIVFPAENPEEVKQIFEKIEAKKRSTVAKSY